MVGLGPAGTRLADPGGAAALAEADDLVGYGPYLDRVPVGPASGGTPSDNTVEAERAAFALDLAAAARRVAVVSSGDPGVFAMATAVLEVAAEPQWKDVPVRVLPGLTAAQAVASRVGAPLGHDFACISLSDRLKPWDGHRGAAGRGRRGRPGDRRLQPGLAQSRTWQVAEARACCCEHRDPDTPVVVGRDVGGPAESVRVVPLARPRPEPRSTCAACCSSAPRRRGWSSGPAAPWSSPPAATRSPCHDPTEAEAREATTSPK